MYPGGFVGILRSLLDAEWLSLHHWATIAAAPDAALLPEPLLRGDQGENRIASSRDAPERLEHCLTRMLPKRRLVVKRQPPDNRAQNAARADTGWLR